MPDLLSPYYLKALTMLVLGSLCFAAELCAQPNPCSRIPGLLVQTSELRGLSSKAPVRCIALNNAQFNEAAKKLESKSGSDDALRAQAKLYRILGIIPADFPFEKCLSTQAGESHFAFYDRTEKQIVLRNDEYSPDFVLVHELTHSLQDQYFGLNKLHELANSTDSDQAISAAVEGDAVFQEERFQNTFKKSSQYKNETSQKEAEPACKPPEPLFSITMFAYEWGLRFAAALYKSGGQELVDQVFIRAPQSSRDILYPAEFIKTGRRALTPIKSSGLKLPGYRLLLRDTLGEFMLRNLLKHFTDMKSGVLAAKGWSGDLIELYQDKKNSIKVRWQIKMDSILDAQELIAALRTYSLTRFGVNIRDNTPNWSAKNGDGYQVDVSSTEDIVQLFISY